MKKNNNAKSKIKKTVISGSSIAAASAAAVAAGEALKDAMAIVADSNVKLLDESMSSDYETPVDGIESEENSTSEMNEDILLEAGPIVLDNVMVTGHAPNEKTEGVGVVDDEMRITDHSQPIQQNFSATADMYAGHDESIDEDDVRILDHSEEVEDVALVIEEQIPTPEPVDDSVDFYDPDEDVVNYMSDDDGSLAMTKSNDGFIGDAVATVKDSGEEASDGFTDAFSQQIENSLTEDSTPTVQDPDTPDYINDANVDAFL